jgi:amino acid transporter
MMENTSSQKKIGLFSATALGVSSILGSGWLFAPYQATLEAGPAAIISWILGAFVIILLSICFSEIAALYPRRGLSAIIPTLSHNKYFAFTFAIANWLGVIAVVALEADATIQYLIHLIPTFEPYLYCHDHLTSLGNSLSVGLVILFTLINYWGAATLIKANNIFAIIKVIIPVFISIVILATAFHPSNFTHINHSFIPYGGESILTAILSTGIIVSFNGFQSVISFSSEIHKPHRVIPASIIIAVLFCLGVYLLIQVAFIAGVPPKMLDSGWQHLELNAPIVQIMGLMGLGIYSTVIYAGATITPSGTAIAFTGTSTRMFTAMARNEQMPTFFDKVHPIYGISRRSLLFNALLAILFIEVFRSWHSLAEVLGLFHVISYLPVPIALWVLRDKISPNKYLFRVPFGKTLSLLLFIFFTYLFTLSHIRTTLGLLAIFGTFLMIFIVVNSRSIMDFLGIIKRLWSLLFYFVLLVLLTAISPCNLNYYSQLQFFTLTTIVSLFCFICLLRTARLDVEIIRSAISLYKE